MKASEVDRIIENCFRFVRNQEYNRLFSDEWIEKIEFRQILKQLGIPHYE